jgi:hypothetical protein
VRMYEEPFKVLDNIGNVTYILELDFHMWHIHGYDMSCYRLSKEEDVF